MKATFRADQVGSFLRPAHLLDSRAQHQSGKLTTEELRREAWQTGFSDAVDGFVTAGRTMVWTDLHGNKVEEPSFSKIVGAKLRQKNRITGIESAFLKEHAPGPYKITMPSPLVVARQSFQAGVTDKVYADSDALLADVLEIMTAELRALVAQHVPYIQIDEGFTGFVGDGWRTRSRELGQDPDLALARAVAAENELYDSIDRTDVTIGTHICRGNSRSKWTMTGSYDALAEQVFGGLHVDRFLLEYDSDRAGSFEALRFVPEGKIAVLGLISTKLGALEAEDTLMRRIEEASRYAPLERLALSPQCGFASVKEGNDITEDDQRRKLELTLRVAEKVWGKVA